MKNNIIRIFSLLIANLIIFGFCNFVTAVELKSVKMDKENITMNVGDTSLLLYTIEPAGTDNVKNKTWLSNDSNIAYVDEYGKITAKNAGRTEVQLVVCGEKENGQQYSEIGKCEVVVEKIAENRITKSEKKQLKQDNKSNNSKVEIQNIVKNKDRADSAKKLILIISIMAAIVIMLLIATAYNKQKIKNEEETKEDE